MSLCQQGAPEVQAVVSQSKVTDKICQVRCVQQLTAVDFRNAAFPPVWSDLIDAKAVLVTPVRAEETYHLKTGSLFRRAWLCMYSNVVGLAYAHCYTLSVDMLRPKDQKSGRAAGGQQYAAHRGSIPFVVSEGRKELFPEMFHSKRLILASF